MTGDPASHRRRIHHVQHPGRRRIGHQPTVSSHIPRGMKGQRGMRGHTDAIGGDGAEDDGAGRGAKAINDHHFSGRTQMLIFVKIGSDAATAVTRDPDHGIAWLHSRNQDARDHGHNQQCRPKPHSPCPALLPDHASKYRCQTASKVRRDSDFVQTPWQDQDKLPSLLLSGCTGGESLCHPDTDAKQLVNLIHSTRIGVLQHRRQNRPGLTAARKRLTRGFRVCEHKSVTFCRGHSTLAPF